MRPAALWEEQSYPSAWKAGRPGTANVPTRLALGAPAALTTSTAVEVPSCKGPTPPVVVTFHFAGTTCSFTCGTPGTRARIVVPASSPPAVVSNRLYWSKLTTSTSQVTVPT